MSLRETHFQSIVGGAKSKCCASSPAAWESRCDQIAGTAATARSRRRKGRIWTIAERIPNLAERKVVAVRERLSECSVVRVESKRAGAGEDVGQRPLLDERDEAKALKTARNERSGGS